MKEISLLLLITLVQCQSDGVLLTGSNHPKKLDDIKPEDWDGSDVPLTSDLSKGVDEKSQIYEKRHGNDILTRRSILDKTFMRFGRKNEEDCQQKSCRTIRSSFYQPKDDDEYLRDERAPRDSFIRFGRGMRDNFIRFGRGARDNFIRFGRGMRDNFIRFGRDGEAGHHAEEFPAEMKRLRDSGFIRFGRNNLDGFERLGKLDQNFIRFGRRNSKELSNGGYDPEKVDKTENAWEDYEVRYGNPFIDYQPRNDMDVNAFPRSFQQKEMIKREASKGKGPEFGEDRKSTKSDAVVRMKRKSEPEGGKNENLKEDDVERVPEAKGENSTYFPLYLLSSRYKAVNRRSTDDFPDSVPGFFPQNHPFRVQSYAKAWNELKNGKNYNYNAIANPPYFPVSTNF